MFKRIGLLLLLVCLLFIPGTVSADKDYVAEFFDVDIQVGSNGSLQVTETITFRFMGGPFTYVYRTLEKTRTDGITFTSAALDGRLLPVNGENALEWVEVEEGDPLTVTWHFEETTDQTRIYTLTYQVEGVVRKGETDAIIWYAIPPEHAYRVQESRITIQHPEGAALAVQPTLSGAESYQVVSDKNPIILTSGPIEADTALVINMDFNSDTLGTGMPVWQSAEIARSERSAKTTPFTVGGFLLGLIGLAAALIVTASRRDPADEISSPASIARPVSPPTDYKPAVAAAVAARDNPTLMHSLATLIDLAGRGALCIEQIPGKWYTPNRFEIVKLSQPTDLSLHEQVLMDALFIKKGEPVQRVSLEQYPQQIGKHIRDFSKAVKTEVALLGLIDPERKKKQNRLLITGTVLILVGVFSGVALALIVVGRPEMLPLGLDQLACALLGGSIAAFLGGLAFIIFAALFSPLTARGRWVASQWTGFSRYLKDIIAKRETLIRPDTFIQFLPYAAGFGLGEQWAKFFQKHGSVEVPAWFHALNAQDAKVSFGVFTTFMSNSSSNTSAGGGGGGGASGGGGSGAG
jgi:uncharacterized membrane protein YgcG